MQTSLRKKIKMNLPLSQIKNMPYADFVGLMGQHNTPPGASKTIERWIRLGKISNDSKVLDLACNTGFSSRSVVKAVGCEAKGIDVSKPSIEMAGMLAVNDGIASRVEYAVGDASLIPFMDRQFSHILAGTTFGFIQNRHQALKECWRVLSNEGLLCIATFYYDRTPPEKILDRVASAVGFRPSGDWDYDWWRIFFETQFTLVEEEDDVLSVLQEDEVTESVRRFIYSTSLPLKETSEEIKQGCFEKLRDIRLVLNEHRQYQRFNVSIWKPNDKIRN